MSRSTRSRSKANHNSAKNLNSPIHRLPNEVLSYIFVEGVQERGPEPTFVVGRRESSIIRAQQLLPGSVCRTWREISHSTPELWRKFAFNPAGFKRDIKFHERMLQTMLQRSGDIDLEVHITIQSSPKYLPSKLVSLGVRALTRAVSLILVLGDFQGRVDIFAQFMPLPPHPRLRHFNVLDNRTLRTSEAPLFDPAQPPTPLVTLHVRSKQPILRLADVDVSLLDDLSLQLLACEGDVHSFVQNCPELRRFNIDPSSVPGDHTLSSSSITHLSIVEFFAYGEIPSGRLGQLPHLRFLTIRLDPKRRVMDPAIPWPQLPSLRVLSLENVEIYASDFGELLQCAPELTAIQLDAERALFIFSQIIPRGSPSNPIESLGGKLQYIRIFFYREHGYISGDEKALTAPTLVLFESLVHYSNAFLHMFPGSRVEWWIDEYLNRFFPIFDELDEEITKVTFPTFSDLPTVPEIYGM